MTAVSEQVRAGFPQTPPAPLPELVTPSNHSTPNSTSPETPKQQRPNVAGFHVSVLSYSAPPVDFSDPEVNRKRICGLLWLAFPDCRSARQVQLKAAIYLGCDERTVRYWMVGETGGPRWDEFAKLGNRVSRKAFLRIVYGRRA